jgi:hypothetical protein
MRHAAVLAATLLLAFAPPARALFHIAVIDELNTAVGGDASEQYVEIRMKEISQNFPMNSRLTAFDCDGSTITPLLVVPGQLPNGGPDVAWIMATSAAATGGIAPDFTFPPGLAQSCGMVCWGSPSAGVPIDPNSWDATDPANYTDCVAYGGYTGPTAAGSGTPSSLSPGNGTQSLTRTTEPACNLLDCTGNDATDLTLECPSPENNAGQVGDPGDCLGVVDAGVAGTKLIVLDKLASAGTAKVVYVSKGDPAIQKGPGAAERGDPAQITARFDVVFDTSSASGAFVMPAGSSWLVNLATVAKYVNRDAPGGAGAVKVAIVKPGKVAKLVAKGLGDGPDVDLFVLPGDFDGPVTTVYEVTNTAPGSTPPAGDIVRMCSRFDVADGGTVVLKSLGDGTSRKLVATGGVATACP